MSLHPNPPARTLERTHDIHNASLVGRYLMATVVNDTDNGQGGNISRIQCRVPEVHGDAATGIPDSALPWFIVAKPIFRGLGAAAGWANTPRIGSRVMVVFDGGVTQSGIALFEVPIGADASAYDARNSTVWGFVDENGTGFKVNAATHDYVFTHRGMTIAVDSTGKTVVTTPADLTFNVTGDAKLTATGKLTVNASEMDVACNLNVTGTVTATTDVVGNGVSLVNHLTSGVSLGSDESGPPVPGT